MLDTKGSFGKAVFESSISTYVKITNGKLQCNLFDEKFTMTQIYVEHGKPVSFAPVLYSCDPDLGDCSLPQVGISV